MSITRDTKMKYFIIGLLTYLLTITNAFSKDITIDMLNKRDGTDEEAKRAREAIEMLRRALQNEPVELEKVDMSEGQPLVRKRLVL